jgi:hypothetical protein
MRPSRPFILIFICCFLALFVWTLSDYGITYDAAMGELYLGDKYFRCLTSLGRSSLDLRRPDVPFYGRDGHPDFFVTSTYAQHHPEHVYGLGPTLTSATKQVFFVWLRWLDPIDAHHLALGLLVALQLLCLYRYCAKYLGAVAAAGAVVCLATYPRYWADAHNNPKDVPEAVFITLTLLAFTHGVYARRTAFILLAGVAGGLALATKANALFVPVILAPWLASVVVERRRQAQPAFTRNSTLAILAAVLIAAGVCLVAWPYLLVDFPDHVLRLARFLTQRGMGGPDHWQGLPLQNAIFTMPLAVMFLSALGIVSMATHAWKGRVEKSLFLLLSLWLIVPIARVSMPRALDFDGIRHWIEFVPALAVFAGLGVDQLVRGVRRWLARRASARVSRALPHSAVAAVLTTAFFLPVVAWNVRHHPFQIVFFNKLIGGLQGAQARHFPQATDYWGSSYRTGLHWLDAHAEPRAMLVVPVEDPVVRAVEEIWLRPDIRLKPPSALPALVKSSLLGERSRPVYVMYVTRPDFYAEGLDAAVATSTVAYEISVDGGVILRILRLSEPAVVTRPTTAR